jgi:tRNA uridine 5-carbamoylmethylation protein Kti12
MSYYIIIRGPLGCGKTTIAKELAKKLNAEHISVDDVLEENNLLDEKEEGYISQKSFKKANEIICKKARPKIKSKTIVIFDGNFYWKSQITDLIERLEPLNLSHYVFTLKAPLNVCIERDSKRKKPHGEMAAKVVYKKTTELDYGIIIDVTQNIENCINEIVSYLPK